MKKITFFAALFIAIIFSVSAAEPVLTVVNDTGYDIYFLYISRASSDSWEEDVLDKDVLLNGDYVNVTLPNAGAWDLKAEDEDEDTYTIYNLRVVENSRVVISIDDLD